MLTDWIGFCSEIIYIHSGESKKSRGVMLNVSQRAKVMRNGVKSNIILSARSHK